jgi:alanine racemase
MDQFMVDVTDLPEVSLGDEVVLMGEGVTADEIADLTGTIHYELTCQLTERVPRIWISDCE